MPFIARVSQKENKMTSGKELLKIRKAFKATRPQFAEIFLGGIHKSTLYSYEIGRYPVPENIMMLARSWYIYLKNIQGVN